MQPGPQAGKQQFPEAFHGNFNPLVGKVMNCPGLGKPTPVTLDPRAALVRGPLFGFPLPCVFTQGVEKTTFFPGVYGLGR